MVCIWTLSSCIITTIDWTIICSCNIILHTKVMRQGVNGAPRGRPRRPSHQKINCQTFSCECLISEIWSNVRMRTFGSWFFVTMTMRRSRVDARKIEAKCASPRFTPVSLRSSLLPLSRDGIYLPSKIRANHGTMTGADTPPILIVSPTMVRMTGADTPLICLPRAYRLD